MNILFLKVMIIYIKMKYLKHNDAMEFLKNWAL
jgi:hypothetical protein